LIFLLRGKPFPTRLRRVSCCYDPRRFRLAVPTYYDSLVLMSLLDREYQARVALGLEAAD
jgi:hypothetical protein